ncbi:MAG: hypothetical protein ACK4YP_01920 [Myxococcota bacterium]
MRRALSAAVLFAACAPAPDTGDTWEPGAYAPIIVSVDRVACANDATLGDVWELALTVDDPQGAATVADGVVSVQDGAGGELGRYPLTCAGGSCTGGFRADYDGIGCAHAGPLVFQVADDAGHVSATRTHP